jgi:hypothetical protein
MVVGSQFICRWNPVVNRGASCWGFALFQFSTVVVTVLPACTSIMTSETMLLDVMDDFLSFYYDKYRVVRTSFRNFVPPEILVSVIALCSTLSVSH